jgi:hypothetical protein
MNRVNNFLVLVLASIVLAACSTPEIDEEMEKEKALMVDCTFPDAVEVAAPDWVCDAPVPGWDVTSVGSAAPTDAGYDFMKDQAAASARVRLAQQMEVHVSNLIKQYIETTGTGDAETVDQVRTSVTKTLVDQDLIGSTIIKSRRSTGGYLYVLVGLDETASAVNAQKALRTSMGKDEALWQQFKAEKGFDELAEDIANQQ